MLDIFSGLRLVVKRRSISIDSAMFRCHWFFTSTLLVSFSLIITARQYVGQPIECHSVDKISESLLNSYCWVQSTFSVPQACNKPVGYDVPYPCIDNTRGREVKMYAYYQWVGMVLFIQGLFFHLPYYLWKFWENGLIRAITGGLRVAVLSDEERAKKKAIVVDYIHDHLGCHKNYAYKYILCECICLINLIVQLWATNKFFDGQFLRYGLDVIHYVRTSTHVAPLTSSDNSNSTNSLNMAAARHVNNNNKLPIAYQQQSNDQQVDPMTYIFPRMTKCTYFDFGSSGDVQKHDALCLLPLNIINEKIYIALWFWFLVLGLITLFVLLHRLCAIFGESVRCKSLRSRCRLCNLRDIRLICRHCDVGDWFLFHMLSDNLDPLIMREIVADIAAKIRAHFNMKREQGMFEPDERQQRDYNYSDTKPYSTFRSFDDIFASYDASPDVDDVSSSNWSHQSTVQLLDGAANTAATAPNASDNSSESSPRNAPQVASGTDEPPQQQDQTTEQRPKKRFYSKRLWSVDLSAGVSELRQHLFGGGGGGTSAAPAASSQTSHNSGSSSNTANLSYVPHQFSQLSSHELPARSYSIDVNAPPSLHTLDSMPPSALIRRAIYAQQRQQSTLGSQEAMLTAHLHTSPMRAQAHTALGRTESSATCSSGVSSADSMASCSANASGASSFVMEMQPLVHSPQHEMRMQELLQRRRMSAQPSVAVSSSSSPVRPPLVRQRSLMAGRETRARRAPQGGGGGGHSHHNSITSMRDIFQ